MGRIPANNLALSDLPQISCFVLLEKGCLTFICLCVCLRQFQRAPLRAHLPFSKRKHKTIKTFEIIMRETDTHTHTQREKQIYYHEFAYGKLLNKMLQDILQFKNSSLWWTNYVMVQLC